MKKSIPLLLITACWLALGAVAPAAEPKIGIVDLHKVFEKYYKTIQSGAALTQEAQDIEKNRKRMLNDAEKHQSDWQKIFDKSNDQAVSSEERDKSKREAERKYIELEQDKASIKEFDKVAATRLHEKQLQRQDDIIKEIRQVLEAEATAAGYTVVLDRSQAQGMVPVVLFTNGQNDMTQALIKELNATAPPGALDKNPAPTGASNLP
jgi:Skp family chaperone for outer membrane proteins